MDRGAFALAAFYGALVLGTGGLAAWLGVRALRCGLLGKELRHYFASPIAWLTMAGFALVNGFVFLLIFDYYSRETPNEPMTRVIFGNSFLWILLFVITPAITMRLLAEERASGTLETLMTAPVRDGEVVFAKFLAALSFFAALMSTTAVPIVTAYYYAVPDGFLAKVSAAAAASGLPSWRLPHAVAFVSELNSTMDLGPVAAAYLGVMLLGAAWIAMGVLFSAMTRNQVVAFVLAFVAAIMSFAIGFGATLLPVEWQGARELVNSLSFYTAFEPFPRGLVDSRNVVYFGSVTAASLFLAVRALESRKWR